MAKNNDRADRRRSRREARTPNYRVTHNPASNIPWEVTEDGQPVTRFLSKASAQAWIAHERKAASRIGRWR